MESTQGRQIVGMRLVSYALTQNACSRIPRRTFATSTSLQLRSGSARSRECTWPRPFPKCSSHGPMGPSHWRNANWKCSIFRGGPYRGCFRSLAAKRRSPRECAPILAIQSRSIVQSLQIETWRDWSTRRFSRSGDHLASRSQLQAEVSQFIRPPARRPFE